jgi:hypothetical protein
MEIPSIFPIVNALSFLIIFVRVVLQQRDVALKGHTMHQTGCKMKQGGVA